MATESRPSPHIRKALSRRRCIEDGIFINSRYLAMVRRAMSMPSALSRSTSWSSENTRSAVSLSIRPRMRDLTASAARSEEHTSELQSLMLISYAVFCLKKKQNDNQHTANIQQGNYNSQEKIE